MNHLLSATILLFAVWPAYYFLLRYSGRYGLNRLLLLLAMVAVVTLPFIDFSSPAPVVTQQVQGTITYLEEGVLTGGASIDPTPKAIVHDEFGEEIQLANPTVVTFNLLPRLYFLGLGLLTLALGFRLLFLLALHLRSRPNGDGTYRLLHPGAKSGQAFTFGRQLYFSIDVPDDPDFDHILAHERIHARQLHSLDILLSEAFLCIFWFHPAAWWLRTNLRANLEYLVDTQVVRTGTDRRSYQLALLRQSQGPHGLALALPFSEPSLKSRIARMTGLPEYRVVGAAAAVALVFWLGLALVVIRGNVFEESTAPGREYLAASAQAGDPYFDYYQDRLPAEITSLEIYTNRMVTVDEYLQLRAILGKVPGAKLYVYKNQFDDGYSLELRFGDHEPAVANGLDIDPSMEKISTLALELNGGSGLFLPISITREIDQIGSVGSFDGVSINHGSGFSSDVLVIRSNTLLQNGKFGNDVQVYVNRERINLVKNVLGSILTDEDLKANDVSVRVNGVDISKLGAASWPEVIVEGRSLPTPQQRIEKLLKSDRPFGGTSFGSAGPTDGTYRAWYEAYGFPQDQPVRAYYNDRKVSVDFLLDTEFGDNAMIQHGVSYDTPQGRYVLQVLDDYAEVEAVMNNRPAAMGNSVSNVQGTQEINLYFRRLPTPQEVKQINGYLSGFPKLDLRVFQDCKNAADEFTLYLGSSQGVTAGTAELSVGEPYNGTLRFELKRNKSYVPEIEVHEHEAMPANAPNLEVFLLIDGVYVNIHSNSAELYNRENLDPIPDLASIKCKLSNHGSTPLVNLIWPDFLPSFWMFTYHSTHPGMLESFNDQLDEKDYGNRPRFFFINDQPVDAWEFDSYQGGENAYVRMGSWGNSDEQPVILEIVD